MEEKKEKTGPQPAAGNTTNRRKGFLIILIIALALAALIIWAIIPMREFVSDPVRLRAYMDEKGPAGVILFIGMVILQVFSTVVPAGPFEIAAGTVFGVGKGVLICVVGMAIASSVVFLLARKLGLRFVRLFFSQEKIDSLSFMHNSSRRNLIVMLLFLIPGAPKDLLTFVVGMSDMPYGLFLIAASVCRIPSILLTVLSGNALATDRKWLFWLLFALVAAVYAIGIVAYGRYRRKLKASYRPPSEDPAGPPSSS